MVRVWHAYRGYAHNIIPPYRYVEKRKPPLVSDLYILVRPVLRESHIGCTPYLQWSTASINHSSYPLVEKKLDNKESQQTVLTKHYPHKGKIGLVKGHVRIVR